VVQVLGCLRYAVGLETVRCPGRDERHQCVVWGEVVGVFRSLALFEVDHIDVVAVGIEYPRAAVCGAHFLVMLFWCFDEQNDDGCSL